ncbi:Hypothetical predicted protein, partial [Paramuricea clavata]
MASEYDVDYHVKHTSDYLKKHKVKVNPSISVAHEIALKKRLAIYPLSYGAAPKYIEALSTLFSGTGK